MRTPARRAVRAGEEVGLENEPLSFGFPPTTATSLQRSHVNSNHLQNGRYVSCFVRLGRREGSVRAGLSELGSQGPPVHRGSLQKQKEASVKRRGKSSRSLDEDTSLLALESETRKRDSGLTSSSLTPQTSPSPASPSTTSASLPMSLRLARTP